MGQNQGRTLVIPFLYVSILTKGPRWQNGVSVCQGISGQWLSPSGQYHCYFMILFSACIVLWPLSCEEWKLEGYPRAEYAKEAVNQCISSSNRTTGHIAFNSLLRKDSLGIGLWGGVPFSDFGMDYIHTWDSWICHLGLWWIEVLPLMWGIVVVLFVNFLFNKWFL